jgi:enoyl-CoA hydratase
MSDVSTKVEDGVGLITLERPKALNALTLPMVSAIANALAAWEEDERVRLVVVRGAGERGLCAGGDIRALHASAVSDGLAFAQDFFHAEYRLNARIASFAKPYVAIMDGIVMGGGIGLSAHGSHRIVTERSRLAMPEVGIGFLPDVGATFLLSSASDELGTHLALTGRSIGAADAIACGLADICVGSESLDALLAAMRECAEAAEIQDCILRFAITPPPGDFALAREWIRDGYAGDDLAVIIAALSSYPEHAAREAAREISAKSPTSCVVTLRALREARGRSLASCLEQEYRLALAMTAGADFREGVRAAVIDKDRAPAWSPSRLADVSPARIESIFAAPDHGGLGLRE